MELKTLGDGLTFGMNLEMQASEVYANAARDAKNVEMKETLLGFAAVNKKRKVILEKIYNENIYSDMDTGIFEPITGLKAVDYLIEIKPASEINSLTILILAIELEEKENKFYIDLASQIKSRRGIARIFEKMAQENYDRKLKLRSIHDKV
jgi:rubrerythrin